MFVLLDTSKFIVCNKFVSLSVFIISINFIMSSFDQDEGASQTVFSDLPLRNEVNPEVKPLISARNPTEKKVFVYVNQSLEEEQGQLDHA